MRRIQRACALSIYRMHVPAQTVGIDFMLPEDRRNLRVLHTAVERWLRPRASAVTTLILMCAPVHQYWCSIGRVLF